MLHKIFNFLLQKKIYFIFILIGIGAIQINSHMKRQDNKSYLSTMLNYYEGNYLAGSDSKIYYRSQVDHYYLYSSDKDGSNRKRMVDKVPGAIFSIGNWIYFVSISDDQNLYRISKDGDNLEKIINQKVKDLNLIGETFYYRSDYNEEYDTNHLVKKNLVENSQESQYIYYFEIDKESPQLMLGYNSICLLSDGKKLYSTVMENIGVLEEGANSWHDIAINVLTREMSVLDSLPNQNLMYSIIYKEHLYYVIYDDVLKMRCLMQKTLHGDKVKKIIWNEDLNIDDCKFYQNYLYIKTEHSIQKINLNTLHTEIIAERLNRVSDFFLLTDGTIFVKANEIKNCGDLWYWYNTESKELVLFEDSVECPYVSASCVNLSEKMKDFPEGSFQIPYVTQEYTKEKYMKRDNTFEGEDGQSISVKLPVFNEKVQGYKKINMILQSRMEAYIQKGKKAIQSKSPGKEQYKLVYYYVYVDDQYTCICYSESFREKGEKQSTILFSTETGNELSMDDLFTVPRDGYLEYISFAIYKELEMRQESDSLFRIAQEKFNENIFAKEFNIEKFILTERGIVVFYNWGSVAIGALHAPFFEISYDYLKPIMKK